MNFAVLKEIIVRLKQKLRCPGCRRKFAHKDITLQGINEDGVDIHIGCRHCHTQVLANISMVGETEIAEQYPAEADRVHRGVRVRANALSTVNENDVLDIRNFLQEFEGSFKTLFQKADSGES